ncbi:MAG: hypothetical protein AB7S38_00945 [Vulcanimicrobiota bacterium]
MYRVVFLISLLITPIYADGDVRLNPKKCVISDVGLGMSPLQVQERLGDPLEKRIYAGLDYQIWVYDEQLDIQFIDVAKARDCLLFPGTLQQTRGLQVVSVTGHQLVQEGKILLSFGDSEEKVLGVLGIPGRIVELSDSSMYLWRGWKVQMVGGSLKRITLCGVEREDHARPKD